MDDDGLGILPYVVFALITFIGLYLLRKYFKGAHFHEKISAHNYVSVITGANSGIGILFCFYFFVFLGFELTRELNLRYVKVYMLCRDEEKGKQAAIKLCKRVNL